MVDANWAGGANSDVNSGQGAVLTELKPRRLVVVDPGVDDWRSLVAELPADARLVVLDPAQDGVHALARAVAGRHGLDAIHVVSHGNAAEALLGSARLSIASLDDYAEALAEIGRALSDGGDILFYGCEIGRGAAGRQFVAALAAVTGADVAAAGHPVGAAARGGRWDLDVSAGDIAARNPFAPQALAAFGGLLNGGDGGRGNDGAGGVDNPTGAGGAGQAGDEIGPGRAGGGGGAGATGGAGGAGSQGSGSGGAGGAHGFVGAALPGVAATGGNGGGGGGGSRGGGGGAGAYGAVVTGSGDLGTLGAAVTGGGGGAGGGGDNSGGNGGTGGHGLLFTDLAGATFTVNAAVQGGDGGAGGAGGSANGFEGEGGAGIVGQNLTITMGATGTVAGGLSGDGVTRANAITFTGGSNTLSFTNAASGLTGNIDVTGSLTFNQSGIDTAVANEITGSGSVVKTGAGTLLLNGVSTYTGGTTVNAGTLGGTGTIGALTVNSGGTLAPGASAGTFSTGNLSFAAGATFAVEIGGAGAGEFDQVAVTGTVTLGNATLDLSILNSFNPATGTTFTIIDNDGVDGYGGSTFAGLGEGALVGPAGNTYSISYVGGTGNDVVLTALDDPTDPLIAQQWYLAAAGGINVLPVWDDYTGAGILIANFDSGADELHEDLATNFSHLYSTNADGGFSYGQPLAAADKQGTATAGLMVADRNGVGMVGVAYDAKLISIYSDMALANLAGDAVNAFNYSADNADVMNNPWSYGNQFLTSQNSAFVANFKDGGFAADKAAVENAGFNGRGGLGVVIVAEAGDAWLGGDDTNLSNFTNNRFTITVAATQQDGTTAAYSTSGASILVSAPGGASADPLLGSMVTTDRRSTDGYDTDAGPAGDYLTTFGGTAAAASLVSGVAALMLEANPSLGARAVQEILAYSAKQTGSAGSYVINHATDWNGGGLHTSTDYGFGLVDATAAVRLAETWELSHGAQTWANVDLLSNSSGGAAVAIPDNDPLGVSKSVVAGAAGDRLVRVEVDLSVTHTWIGDLVVTLTMPSGTVSTLMNRPGLGLGIVSPFGSQQDNVNFVFDTVQGLGETANGTWTVNVSDRAAGDTGTFDGFTLIRFYENSLDNTYVYTNEYATFAGVSGHSQMLTDANGGTDTINAAAVTTDSIIDLVDGVVSTIAGQSLTIAAGTVIENAIGGDGGDSLIGNSSANLLYGGRGGDFLQGLGGADTLSGGAGNDTFLYHAAGDLVAGESVDGGAGTTDALRIVNPGAFNFAAATLTGIERLEFNDVSSTATFLGTQIGAGAITQVSGATGADAIVVNAASDVDLSAVTFTAWTAGDTIAINGTAGGETLTGSSKNDIISGMGGVDTLIGGSGNDTFVLGAEATGVDTVTDAAGTADLITTTISRSLADFATIENLTLLGTAINGTGNGLANVITGNGENNLLDGGVGIDTLIGGGGLDTLIGGNGNDAFHYFAASDLVAGESVDGGADTDELVLDDAGNMNFADATLTGIEAVRFAAGFSTATFRGTQIGGFGTITQVTGGGIDDTAIVVNAASDVNLSALTFTTWSSFSSITVNGTGSGESLTGSSQSDTLNGRGGGDTLIGGGGDDHFFYSAAGDLGAGESLDGGADLLDDIWLFNPGAYSFTAATLTGIEAVRFFTGGATATFLGTQIGGVGAITQVFGSAGANVDALVVNAASNVNLSALTLAFWTAGTDTITINGTGSGETLTGSSQRDTIIGLGGIDRLIGGAEKDALNGGAGNDILTGGLGKDTLIGGGGLDKFDFNAIGESVKGANRDFISGFSHAQHDRIDLAGIDADQRAANPGNDVFKFIGTQSFAAYHAAHLTVFGMVRVAPGGIIQLNVNANLGVDAEIKVTGLASFAQGDFFL